MQKKVDNCGVITFQLKFWVLMSDKKFVFEKLLTDVRTIIRLLRNIALTALRKNKKPEKKSSMKAEFYFCNNLK